MATSSLSVPARRRFCLLLCLSGLCLSGCVALPEWTTHRETVPSGVVHEVHSDWEPRIVVTRDTESNGAPLQGLAGRVYLFDAGFHPIRGEGALDFVVYDISKPGESVWVNAWSYDKDNLNSHLFRKDEGITWG